MMFVERRAGVVTGVYARRQPGYAEEELADNHPDVLAFLAPKAPPTKAERIDAFATNPVNSALLDELAQARGIPKAALIASMKARP